MKDIEGGYRHERLGVGAQNDLGGHQSFARKMTSKLPDKSTVFSVQIEMTSEKKKRSSLKLRRFFCPALEIFY